MVIIKRFKVPACFLFLALMQCRDSKLIKEEFFTGGEFVKDSFLISKLATQPEELGTVNFLNDSTFITNDIDGNLTFYKSDQNKVFRASEKLNLKVSENGFYFVDVDTADKLFYVLCEKKIYRTDYRLKLKDSLKLSYKTDFLDTNYFLSCSNTMPLILKNGFLYCNYSHNDVVDFYETCKEKGFFKIGVQNKLQEFNTCHNKPKQLAEYDSRFMSSHALIKDDVVKLYPPFDTLYLYSTTSGRETKVAINNPYYRLPEKFQHNKFSDFKYLTNHLLSNFFYEAIFYNETNQHSILFFREPTNISGRKATFNDQRLNAIVLDENFKVIKSIVFNQEFFSPHFFFQYSDKGIAMPLSNQDPLNEATKYYIFSY